MYSMRIITNIRNDYKRVTESETNIYVIDASSKRSVSFLGPFDERENEVR
jgi:hypothetical protein